MTTTLVGGYEREALARFAGETDWLRTQREAAFAAFERLPLPTTQLEEWRYTDPAQLRWDQVALASPETGGACVDRARRTLQGKLSAGRVIQCGGYLAEIHLPDALREQGVILADLATAAQEHGELVEAHLGRALPAEAGKFAALNAAFWSAGVFIYVPRGVRIDAPIRIVRWVEDAGLAYFPRTLLVAGEGSEVGLVEEFRSPDLAAPTFCSAWPRAFACPARCGCWMARSIVPLMRAASRCRPLPPSMTTLRPSRSAAWMPCVPSWIMFRRLSRQYCSTGKSRV